MTDKLTREERPWGSFEVIREGEGFKVKSIIVKPGGRLSLQYHDHRAEQWVVARGTARVLVSPLGGEDRAEEVKLRVGENISIPTGHVHRLTNDGRSELELIEVQTGDYLGEDDIVRLSDDYGRS